MVKCAIINRAKTILGNKQNLNQFPKDRNMMNKWIGALKQSNFEPNIWTKVCSVHFHDSNYYETKKGLRKLLSTAVPSLLLDDSLCDITENASSNSQSEQSTSTVVRYDSEVPSDECPQLTHENNTPGNQKLKMKLID